MTRGSIRLTPLVILAILGVVRSVRVEHSQTGQKHPIWYEGTMGQYKRFYQRRHSIPLFCQNLRGSDSTATIAPWLGRGFPSVKPLCHYAWRKQKN